MDLVPLGRSGLTVSRIGLGLAALGRPGYINLGHGEDVSGRRTVSGLRAHAASVLDAAYGAGVRYFDAARSYGRAEAFLAAWLDERRIEPGAVTIGSKWGYAYTAGWRTDAPVHEVKDHTLDTLDRQHAESVDVLGDRLDLYQIHSATEPGGVLDRRDVLHRLARLRSAGTAIGITTSGPGQAGVIRRCIEIEVDGVPLFDAVQATWNLLERSAGAALGEAGDAGLGVIVKEALANGRLTARNPGLPVVLRNAEHSADALAIAAALAQPWSHVILSGAATVEQLRSNLRALRVPAAAAGDLEVEAETPAEYWERRSRLPWT